MNDITNTRHSIITAKQLIEDIIFRAEDEYPMPSHKSCTEAEFDAWNERYEDFLAAEGMEELKSNLRDLEDILIAQCHNAVKKLPGYETIGDLFNHVKTSYHSRCKVLAMCMRFNGEAA